MTNPSTLSFQTRRNWWINAVLFISAVLAALSGVYFLFLPNGGYMGGRNPWYGIIILFTRHTWDLIHTWGGVVMIGVAVIHLALHWSWVVNMTGRTIKELTGKNGRMNAGGRFNLMINTVVAFSFLLVSVSGIYFLFYPGGRAAVDPQILFKRVTWDLIHAWSGVVLIIAALLHFTIHWKWVTKVTRKIFAPLGGAKVSTTQPGSVPSKTVSPTGR